MSADESKCACGGEFIYGQPLAHVGCASKYYTCNRCGVSLTPAEMAATGSWSKPIGEEISRELEEEAMASDAETKLEPCRWCYKPKHKTPRGTVMCKNSSCAMCGHETTPEKWNRRESPPGAVEVFVDSDGWDLFNNKTLRHCAFWRVRLRDDDIRVTVTPERT